MPGVLVGYWDGLKTEQGLHALVCLSASKTTVTPMTRPGLCTAAHSRSCRQRKRRISDNHSLPQNDISRLATSSEQPVRYLHFHAVHLATMRFATVSCIFLLVTCALALPTHR
jgi:hypothetical protein